jgi:hypothetical protein
LGGAAGETLEGGIDWPRSCGGGGAGALSDRIKRARERERRTGGREVGLVVGDGWWIGSEKVGLLVEEEES